MTPEKRYEHFLLKNSVISSNLDHITKNTIDRKGKNKFLVRSVIIVFAFLLQVLHMIAIALPEKAAKSFRRMTGDYLSSVGYPGIAFTVILLLISINGLLDRWCFWWAERTYFPALTHILTFRDRLSVDSANLFEKRLNICSKLEKIADIAFVHPPLIMHSGIVIYNMWIRRDIVSGITEIISVATNLFLIRDFIMVIIASQTMLQLSTKFLCLQIDEIIDEIRKFKGIRCEGEQVTVPEIRHILDHFDHVKRQLHVLQHDAGWSISNSMIVFMPVIGFITMGAIGSKDLMVKLFFSCVSSNFCLLFLLSISTAANVHTRFKSLHAKLSSLQLRGGMKVRDKVRLDRTLKVIAGSKDRSLSFYVCSTFPFDSKILLIALTQILSMILLLLPQFDQLQAN